MPASTTTTQVFAPAPAQADLDAQYQILGPLGSSLTGRSFLARHRELGRLVVIKLRHESADARVRARFEREARALSRLEHAHVAALLAYGKTADGRRYMIVEHVEGSDLRTALKRWGRLPERRALRLLDQLARALEAVHAEGLVHRNLKPESVLLGQGRDGGEIVKLTNFGLVRDAEGWTGAGGSERTRTGPMHGTPSYWSPEQVLGQPADVRSDIYSFGVVAYELLTGAPPFSSTTTEGFAWQHVRELPARPLGRDGRPRLSREVERVLIKCLAKLPEQRFASARELRRAIAEARAGQRDRRTRRAPGSLAERLAARAREPETWLMIGGAFLAGLLGALVAGG